MRNSVAKKLRYNIGISTTIAPDDKRKSYQAVKKKWTSIPRNKKPKL